MSAEQLDQTFFIKKVQGVHYKSAIPAVGSVRNDGTDVERYQTLQKLSFKFLTSFLFLSIAGSSTNISMDGLQKPGKKHFKKNKKEKLRRVYGYLDQY